MKKKPQIDKSNSVPKELMIPKNMFQSCQLVLKVSTETMTSYFNFVNLESEPKSSFISTCGTDWQIKVVLLELWLYFSCVTFWSLSISLHCTLLFPLGVLCRVYDIFQENIKLWCSSNGKCFSCLHCSWFLCSSSLFPL